MALEHSWGKRSLKHQATLHPDLKKLTDEILKLWPTDITIIEGHREASRQKYLFDTGKSKVQKGKHNFMPSQAVDIAPIVNGKIDWNNRHQWILFGGFVLGVAASLGLNIRWGGDWDRDADLSDQTFNDYVHFEVRL